MIYSTVKRLCRTKFS